VLIALFGIISNYFCPPNLASVGFEETKRVKELRKIKGLTVVGSSKLSFKCESYDPNSKRFKTTTDTFSLFIGVYVELNPTKNNEILVTFCEYRDGSSLRGPATAINGGQLRRRRLPA
jgi:hypothetical protein